MNKIFDDIIRYRTDHTVRMKKFDRLLFILKKSR